MEEDDTMPKPRSTRFWTRVVESDEGLYRFGAPSEQNIGYALEARPRRKFCTGSEYEGTYNSVGFSGTGIYKYPHGPIYEGEFKNGNFHGAGNITYPKGQKCINGIWKEGKLINFVYEFSDGLEYLEPWYYCLYPDRRYRTEVTNGLNPTPIEALTNTLPPRKLNENCYDTCDGYYKDKSRIVFNYRHECLRMIEGKEEEMIRNKYRAWKEFPVGYRPDLYEKWTTGINDGEQHSVDSDSFEDTDLGYLKFDADVY